MLDNDIAKLCLHFTVHKLLAHWPSFRRFRYRSRNQRCHVFPRGFGVPLHSGVLVPSHTGSVHLLGQVPDEQNRLGVVGVHHQYVLELFPSPVPKLLVVKPFPLSQEKVDLIQAFRLGWIEFNHRRVGFVYSDVLLFPETFDQAIHCGFHGGIHFYCVHAMLYSFGKPLRIRFFPSLNGLAASPIVVDDSHIFLYGGNFIVHMLAGTSLVEFFNR